jgi:tetratricopeptide (TPR) repeat protein
MLREQTNSEPEVRFMDKLIRKSACFFSGLLLAGALAYGQTGAIEGDVKGEDGKGLQGAQIKITRTDIKGNYKVKSDKKGHFFHAGLPLGNFDVTLEIDGKDVDSVRGVRTRLGEPVAVNFDLKARKQQQEAMAKAAESGTLSKEQTRDMTPEQRAALEKQMKERAAALAKNKALSDAFNAGREAMNNKQWDTAVEQLTKAGELDATQHVVWAQLADAYSGQAGTKTGEEQTAVYAKAMEAWGKALAIKPDDAAYHNNYALLLARAKKFDEAQAELTKAAQLDPTQAGKYYYNLGAVLVNTGQIEPAGEAFKKAIEADPTYADAQYQYGVYLVSKAQVSADGKVTPPPGTAEAFQKYLELKPDGPFAEAAKGMLQTISGTVSTTYSNPSAPAKKAAPKKK